MKIYFNGTPKAVAEGTTVKNLILSLKQKPENIVIEHNGSIIKTDDWDSTIVQDGDKIEAITFVGGG